MSIYNRKAAISYAKKHAHNPNPQYPYYDGWDCTNFVSQCIYAGGALNDFSEDFPWWCVDMKTSICWSVAHSFYWYILNNTQKNSFGIKAITKSIYGDHLYDDQVFDYLQIGDIIQYSWKLEKINHSTIITDFTYQNGQKIPLITQHQPDHINRIFYRNAKRTIFHHITSIN
jgi:hypothetical protein